MTICTVVHFLTNAYEWRDGQDFSTSWMIMTIAMTRMIIWMIWSSAGWISCDLEKSSIMDSCTLHSPCFTVSFQWDRIGWCSWQWQYLQGQNKIKERLNMNILRFQTIDQLLLSGVRVGVITNTKFGFSDNQTEAFVRSQRWKWKREEGVTLRCLQVFAS